MPVIEHERKEKKGKKKKGKKANYILFCIRPIRLPPTTPF